MRNSARSNAENQIHPQTVLVFVFFDCNEPIHVHVRRENKTCKFWLEGEGTVFDNRPFRTSLCRFDRIVSAPI